MCMIFLKKKEILLFIKLKFIIKWKQNKTKHLCKKIVNIVFKTNSWKYYPKVYSMHLWKNFFEECKNEKANQPLWICPSDIFATASWICNKGFFANFCFYKQIESTKINSYDWQLNILWEFKNNNVKIGINCLNFGGCGLSHFWFFWKLFLHSDHLLYRV